MSKKIILHLCADTGSDSKPYKDDPEFEVLLIGKDIGVENFTIERNVFGVIANPVCTEFSTARSNGKARSPDQGMFLVNHCLRIIKECKPSFWLIENPARGVLKKYLGDPNYKYQPWQYGSPWTKETALWGKFVMPKPLYTKWEDVPKIKGLYTRPNRGKPSLAFMHKSHKKYIQEFDSFEVDTDAEFRSLCSQGFAKEFYKLNNGKSNQN